MDYKASRIAAFLVFLPLVCAVQGQTKEKQAVSPPNLSLPSDNLRIGDGTNKTKSASDLNLNSDNLPVGGQAGEKDPAEELAEIQKKVNSGELPKVQFDFDSAKIRPDSYPTLDAVADLLMRNPKYKLLVTAHTCTLGTAEYNFKLSLRRAKSVKGYLVKKGVPPPSIRFRGKGFSEPIADNSTDEGRIKNRRVEFQLLRRWWSSVY